jgi:hypothetical protein
MNEGVTVLLMRGVTSTVTVPIVYRLFSMSFPGTLLVAKILSENEKPKTHYSGDHMFIISEIYNKEV